MVKLAKAAKSSGKPKKAAAPPPKDVEDSEEEGSEEEEDASSEEEEVPQKKAVTPAKAAGTPGKKGATPAKTATPAKPAVTPGKKAAAAKNGKKAQKKESSDEDDEEEEDEEEDEGGSESEEETPPAKKPAAKKPSSKADKPSKKKVAKQEDSEEEDDDDEDDSDAMDTTPAPAKVKPAAGKTKAKAGSSDEEDGDEEMEDDDEDEEDDDEEGEEKVTDSGKRKKEVPKDKTPEAKKPKKEGAETFSLFIANLDAEKDFDELKDAIRNFFTKKNFTVSDVRLGQSKKFGYVDFSTEEDLDKAVELSGKKILGLEIKMEKARSKEDTIESKKERNLRTVFVKNLPYSITSDTLQELFANAVDVRIPLGGNGSSRGVAYIEFKTEAEAEKALEEKQGTDVEGRAIILDYTGDKAGTAGGEQKVLVINNLAYSVTESALQELFEKAVSCKIPQNNQGRAKGFAFVEFNSAEDCKEALKTHNNTEIEGRSIRLELKGSQQGGRAGASGQTKTLFVRGLSEDTTEESLRDAFEGAVGARIAMDRDTGSSKGFGFVDFSTFEEAKAAKESMEDGEIDGNKVTLDFAKPKGDGGRGGFGRGGGRGFGRGRGGFGGRGGGGGGRGGGGRGGGRGFGGGYGGGRGGGGGFRGGNRGKKIRFDD